MQTFVMKAHSAQKQGLGGFRIKLDGMDTKCQGPMKTFKGRAELWNLMGDEAVRSKAGNWK